MIERPRSSRQDHRLSFFNNVLYSTLPGIYNALDWLTLGAWWRLVRRALEYTPPHRRILEIGFGPGRLHAEMARRASLCAGLDLAPGMCRFTRKRLERDNLPIAVVQGNTLALPFAPGIFDVVVSTFALSGMPHADHILAQIARVLAPGGRVVLVDIGLPADGNCVGIFWARLWERMGDYLYDQPALMSAADLRIIAYEEYGPGKHIRVIVGEK